MPTLFYVCVLSHYSCVWVFATLWAVVHKAPMGCSTPWDSPGKNTRAGCQALLLGIFPTKGSNLDLPYCRQILYHLSQVKMDEYSISSFSLVQLLSHVQLFATPWIAARQASLSITNSRSLLKLMSIESVMPSSHLILSPPSPPVPNPSWWSHNLRIR